ncbi:conserved hypothetical protein [Thiomonas sp. X19]|uniref:type II toxin-antitoxin system VapC family toxin n=1 Tax=Thiomonas sp. X19 TaxID=1050370 RepID=UPI000B65DFB8|nr:type II toxin-antitoxin system VapC family toxin [Thiomonas sp. X19]SCC95526.1 conserved hypothetical protein [Thiomonas sp. X19]
MTLPSATLYVAEPPEIYLARTPAVVDCSVLAAVLFEERERDLALEQLRGKSLHAPGLLGYEMASVARKKRAGGWPEASVALALEDFDAQRIQLHTPLAAEQVDLALRYGLSAYDAAYLWLAASIKAPLLTFDRLLGEAARQHLASLA